MLVQGSLQNNDSGATTTHNVILKSTHHRKTIQLMQKIMHRKNIDKLNYLNVLTSKEPTVIAPSVHLIQRIPQELKNIQLCEGHHKEKTSNFLE